MKSLLVLFILVNCICQAQSINEIFKSETRTENGGIGAYNVNVLVLYSDESYKIFWYNFFSKKMVKNFYFSGLEIEGGKWFRKNKVLNLLPSKGNQKLKFYYQRKNRIRVIKDNNDLAELKWKKVADHPR